MRDDLCTEEETRKNIELYEEFIAENKEEIEGLEKDIMNGIQRYPKDNQRIIEGTHLASFRHRISNINAKYSLGEDIFAVEVDYQNALDHLEQTGERKVGYVNLLWMISLGILLETDKNNLVRLSKIVEQKEVNDFVIDYLLCSSDIGWTYMSDAFFKGNPYAKTKEIIELAQTDKEAASNRLQLYMEKEWLRGHYDYGWKNTHEEGNYVGYWSFEAAALAKILKLEDTALKNHNRYPYDLAHYKDSMTFKAVELSDVMLEDEVKKVKDGPAGIENNPSLEKVFPIKWHAFVNELIYDYEHMADQEFYEKYKKIISLDQIWFHFEEYEAENKEKNLLGTLLVFAMTEKEYILQLDYKDELEDYASDLKTYWKQTETKLVQFILDNDQNYYALVPTDMNVGKMYEVVIQEVVQD